jgi:transcriptional regulator with XRE-family HTH domain
VTDADRERSGSEGAEGGDSERPSIGQYLAQQRRLRGISIQELCERTKLPRRNIERLESGALDDQLDGFARGFVRTLAGALGLDADEAVMRLMREPEAEEVDRELALRRSRRLRLGALAAALALVALLGAVTLEWLGGGGEPGPQARPDREVTYRSDVVRALAREGAQAPPPRAAPGDVAPPPSAP